MEFRNLFEIASASSYTSALMTVCQLDVASHIDPGLSKSAQDISKELGVDAKVLMYVMRTCTAKSIFHEIEKSEFPHGSPFSEGVFRHTRSSLMLREQSIRDALLMRGGRINMLSWGGLQDLVQTGEPDLKKNIGYNTVWEYYQNNQDENGYFNRSMTTMTRMVAPGIVSTTCFKNFETVCDVGGGHGFLLLEILKQNPHLKSGINFDIKSSSVGNTNTDTLEITDPRFKREYGSIVNDDVPAADCYTFKNVLHIWKDDMVVSILKKVASKMNKGGCIYVYELLFDEDQRNENNQISPLYLHIMLHCGGVERENKEWEIIGERAGLKVKEISVIPNQMFLPLCKVCFTK